MDINKGDVCKVKYPFIYKKVSLIDEDGPYETYSWLPGTDYAFVYPDDSEAIAHGNGEMILTIVDIHKPGKYPTRVFYERKWRDPDGNIFGKGGLHIATVQKFKRLISGYYHDYKIVKIEK